MPLRHHGKRAERPVKNATKYHPPMRPYPTEILNDRKPAWCELSRSARDVQPRMSLSSPQRHFASCAQSKETVIRVKSKTSQCFLRLLFFSPKFRFAFASSSFQRLCSLLTSRDNA